MNVTSELGVCCKNTEGLSEADLIAAGKVLKIDQPGVFHSELTPCLVSQTCFFKLFWGEEENELAVI